MARPAVLILPVVVLYTLVLLDRKRPLDASISSAPSTRPSLKGNRSEGHASVQTERVLGANHGANPSHTEDTQKASTEKYTLASSVKEVPSCVRKGGVAKSFLVIFMGHSGSSALISELRGHSKVYIEAAELVDHGEYEFNTSLALERTRKFFARGIRQGKVPGFKMRPFHIRQKPQAWAALAKEFDTRIVWQYRKNIVKQAVGEYSKKYFGDKSSVEGLKSKEEVINRCSTGAGCRFTISDFGLFHRILKDCLHSDVAIARSVNLMVNGSKCVHDLPYEDYLYSREETIRSLQRFLGLKFERTAPNRFKATSDSLCKVVGNWGEVCENFYGCHVWRHMFEDERNGCSCEFSSGSTKYCDTVFKN